MKAASLMVAGATLILSAWPSSSGQASMANPMHVSLLLGLAQSDQAVGEEQELAAPIEPEAEAASPANESEAADGGNEPGEAAPSVAPDRARNRERRSNSSAADQERARVRSSRNRPDRGPGERQFAPGNTSRRRSNSNSRRDERRPGASSDRPDSALGRDYARFKIITDRNIFNASRSARSSRPREEFARPGRADTVSLVGTLSSEKGDYAFFDGSSFEYRKVLPVGKTIVGYSIAAINPLGVNLTAGTNSLDLQVGMQLRRDDGKWHLVGESRTPMASASSGSTASTEISNSDENDVIKRLMQQREQELK